MKKRFLLAAIVALWLRPLLASDDASKQRDAITKIEQAVAKTNIFELPSFQMKANVEIEAQGKFVDGSYQLLWNGPEQWREEIYLPGYTEVQVGGKGTIWIQRSTNFYPLRISTLHAALGFGSGAEGSISGPAGSLVQSGLTEKDKVKKIRERKTHGETQTCIEYENELGQSSEICVNENTNTLIRRSSYMDRDIQPVGGGKVYPRFLSFVENGKTVARANIAEFTTSGQFPPNSFAPLSGVSPQAGCMNPTPPRLIKKLTPRYPQGALQQRVQGLVALDVWIGLDGVPRIGKVVAHANPKLEQSSVNALREWRFEPAACNGKPVEVEAVLSVDYALRH